MIDSDLLMGSQVFRESDALSWLKKLRGNVLKCITLN